MNAEDSQKKRSSQELFSYHAFLLPFRWDCASPCFSNKNAVTPFDINPDYEKRLNVSTFAQELIKNKWTYRSFRIDHSYDYNEYVYFYPHAQKVLFNAHETLKKGLEQKAASYCFEYTLGDKRHFHIHIRKNANKKNSIEKRFSLLIDSITLTVFDTGIAVLQFSLENRKHNDFDDVLMINDFGRRIYPQFLGGFEDPKLDNPIEKTRDVFYPALVELSSEEDASKTKTCAFEEFYYSGFSSNHLSIPETCKGKTCRSKNSSLTKIDLSKNPVIHKLPHYIEELFGKRFKTHLSGIGPDDILITPVIDDRMFVISAFADSNNTFDDRTERLKTISNDKWFQFVFVDGNWKGAANRSFENDLLTKHSYDRWSEYGTRYGISRYSFVVLVKGSFTDNTNDFPQRILEHCKTMYLRAIFLSLTQRASIIRFSEEIAHISRFSADKAFRKTDELYKHYIRFVNKYHFTEITAQEQGIEIYSMIQRHMGIRENLAALREEISDLHAYADLISEKKRGDSAKNLNIIAALFLIPTLITGFFGMNVFDKNDLIKNYPLNLKGFQCSFEIPVISIAIYIPLIFFFIFIIPKLLCLFIPGLCQYLIKVKSLVCSICCLCKSFIKKICL